jgi:hypothetical protein
LWADFFVQHRAHRAIRDKNRIFQPFIEVKNLQERSAEDFWNARFDAALNVFVP